jgi:hypothetical protein
LDEVILDCYRLAKYYGRNPEEFLSLPVSRLLQHLKWTGRLEQARREAAAEQQEE